MKMMTAMKKKIKWQISLVETLMMIAMKMIKMMMRKKKMMMIVRMMINMTKRTIEIQSMNAFIN